MKKLLFYIFIAFSLVSALADSVSLELDNDCLLRQKRDEDMTHSTKFLYNYKYWYFSIQQNMYTPVDITQPIIAKGDRAFCGWLGTEIGKEIFADNKSPWTHYVAANIGVTGPWSLAGDTQTVIHRWLDCRKPCWTKDNQMANEVCVNAQYFAKYNWFICDYVALVPRAGILAGTVQDAAEAGGDLKIGYNMKKDVGQNILFSATKDSKSFFDNVTAYIFCGGDCRYYLYNHFLEGSLFNSHDDQLGVEICPFVGELQAGAQIEIYGVFIRYVAVFRTFEFKGQQRKPDFGCLQIGYMW